MTSKTGNIDALFQNAVDQGTLSKSAVNALSIRDIGVDINNALGVSVDDVSASQVTLVTFVVDDSGSIRFGSNADLVREGHNLVLDSLSGSKIIKDSTFAMCIYLNGHVLYPYIPVVQATRMNAQNYNPNGGTPLYNTSITALGAVLAKCQEFLDNGVACRTITAIITDGANAWHGGNTAADVKAVVSDMLKAENHIIAGMGIDDGSTDFTAVFKEMGIRPEWMLNPKNSPSEIRKAFGLLSQSAQRASQGAGSFSQTALGGFGTP